jgi:RND family efflux transporter MFP subunit
MTATRRPLRTIAIAGIVLLAACDRHAAPPIADVALPAIPVQVAIAQRENVPVILETSGTVRAVQRATLAAKIGGSIERLSLALGQHVQAGEVLLTLSAAELSARVAQARAQLTQVERELARERTLESTGAGTIETVRALEDRLTQTRAALREAETMLSYTTIHAPFDGTVARKFVETGDFATPGSPLLQLDGRDAFEIEVGLPESAGAGIGIGSLLDVTIPATATHFRAKVVELSSAADFAARATTAKLAVPKGSLVRPGQFARIALPVASASVLLVPVSAVTSIGQMERLFTVDERNRTALRLVKTGAIRGDRVEIVSGLDAGDRVVIAPPAALRDGQPVDVAP